MNTFTLNLTFTLFIQLILMHIICTRGDYLAKTTTFGLGRILLWAI